jgi:hypothetical protein
VGGARPARATHPDLAAHLPTLERPGDLAERLPKALIHHNVPGEPVHGLLRALDEAWDRAAPYATFGSRARWVAACEGLDWPQTGPVRHRFGELTVPWRPWPPGSQSLSRRASSASRSTTSSSLPVGTAR